MRTTIQSTMKCVVMAVCVMLAACTADVYEPKPEPTPEPEKPQNGGFNQGSALNTVKDRTLSVVVEDYYEGKFYYTVEAFVEDPIFVENAKSVSSSKQKTNSNFPYSRVISIPDVVKTLFIEVTDPYQRSKVYSVEVSDNMSLDLNPVISTKSAGDFQLRAVESTIDFKKPNNAISISNSASMKSGGVYYVPEGTTLKGLSFPLDGNVTLYVEGSVETGAVDLYPNTKLIVNGQLLASNSSFNFRDGASFAVSGEANLKGCTIIMGNNTQIVNYGEFICGSIDFRANNAKIVNRNHLTLNNLQRGLTSNVLIDNACQLIIEGSAVFNKGVEVVMAPNAYLEVGGALASAADISMDTNSMISVKGSLGFEGGKIDGPIVGNALLLVGGAVTGDIYNPVKCKNRITIACRGQWSGWGIDRENGASLSQLNTSTYIKPSEDENCGNMGNGEEPGTEEGEGDTNPEVTDTNPLSFTCMFEDNWPAEGDYDMNDVVMKYKVIYSNNVMTKTSSAEIQMTVLAVGATKKLAVGYQLDGITTDAVNRISVDRGQMESGQSNVVMLPIWDVHKALDPNAGNTTINTYKLNVTPYEYSETIHFNKDVTIRINPFIVYGDWNNDKRSEIHLPGFRGTDKANVASKDYDYFVDGTMWGIRVANMESVTWPKETLSISNAYEGFASWTSTGSGENGAAWYNSPIEDNVIAFE